MEWSQGLRQRMLGPLLTRLAKLGVTADQLTFLSLLSGLGFCPLLFWSPPWAFALLALHVLLDGLDGPLSRFQGAASRRGSLTDSLCDQIVVAATTVTAMAHPDRLIQIWPGAIYLFVYTVVVGFAMVRNALGAPYSWLLRPRFVVYGWLALEVFAFAGTSLAGSINYLLWFCNVLLAAKLVTGFRQIRKRI